MTFADVFGIGGSNVTVLDATVMLIRNDDYASITFPVDDDYTGYTGLFTIRHRVTDVELLQASVSVASPTALNTSLTSTDTAFADLVSLDEFGPHPFDIEMTDGSSTVTAVMGVAVIRKDQTT